VVPYPTIFTRFANTQIGHDVPVVQLRASTHLDFEGELAIVIGTVGRYIPKDKAMAHIAGYSCYNDVSVRDWQRHTIQFTPCKNVPATGPFGPYLVTPDEVGPLPHLKLMTRLNGQIVQEAMLGDMIFDIPTIVAYCSTFTQLKIGDVVEVEIDRVGLLGNSIVDEAGFDA